MGCWWVRGAGLMLTRCIFGMEIYPEMEGLTGSLSSGMGIVLLSCAEHAVQ
jgi:hypothetical protein